MVFRVTILGLFLCLAAWPVRGQETNSADRGTSRPTPPRVVDFQDALRLFAQNNLSLLRIRADVQEASSRVRQQQAFPNPTLNVTHEPISNGAQSVSETYVNVSQRLAFAGRGSAVEAARHTARAAEWRASADSARLAMTVAETYLEAASAAERRRRMLQVTEIFRQADSILSAREEIGDASGYAVRRMRLERARYENRLAAANLRRDEAERRLALLILPERAPTVSATTLPSGVPPSIAEEEALREAIASRPELDRWNEVVSGQRSAVDAARLATWPEPTVTAGYKTQSDGFDGVFLGVAIPLPLFDRNRGETDAARARLSAAQARKMQAEQAVRNEVLRAHSAYVSARRQYALVSDDLLEGSDDLLRIARVSYSEGEMSLIELLDAADAYRDAQIRRLDLREKLWNRYLQLLHAMGRPLRLSS